MRPMLRFQSKAYHPYIHASNGLAMDVHHVLGVNVQSSYRAQGIEHVSGVSSLGPWETSPLVWPFDCSVVCVRAALTWVPQGMWCSTQSSVSTPRRLGKIVIVSPSRPWLMSVQLSL